MCRSTNSLIFCWVSPPIGPSSGTAVLLLDSPSGFHQDCLHGDPSFVFRVFTLFITWTFDLWRVPGIFSSLSYAPLFRCLRYSDSVSVIFILLLPTRGLRRTWAPFRFSLSSRAPSRSQDSCPSILLSRVDSLRDGLRLSLANISMAFGPI